MAGESVCGGACGLSERRASRLGDTSTSVVITHLLSMFFNNRLLMLHAMFDSWDLRMATWECSREVTAEVHLALAIALANNNEHSWGQLVSC